MTRTCDICKVEVPDGKRFCPQCGLELVTRRDRPSPPLETHAFEWDEPPDAPVEYGVVAGQVELLGKDRLAELIELAETRLGEGYSLEASALLRPLEAEVASHADLKKRYDRAAARIRATWRSIREQCEQLAESGDSESLLALLAGRASNELESDELCRTALDCAQQFFERRDAIGAAAILKLTQFRTTRDDGVIRRHRELELQVHRIRARRHAARSAMVFAAVMAAGAVALTAFTLAVWYGGLGITLGILVALGSVIAAAALVSPWRDRCRSIADSFRSPSDGQQNSHGDR